jgi:hypothetical protein
MKFSCMMKHEVQLTIPSSECSHCQYSDRANFDNSDGLDAAAQGNLECKGNSIVWEPTSQGATVELFLPFQY